MSEDNFSLPAIKWMTLFGIPNVKISLESSSNCAMPG